MKDSAIQKLNKREAVIGIIGLGYVGLPLLMEFSKGGFPVIGFDTDPAKVESLKAGRSYIRHIAPERIAQVFGAAADRADATSDFTRIRECDAMLICVPTPLTGNREPDMTLHREDGAQHRAPPARPASSSCLESTTYPGTTEDVLVPILERGLRTEGRPGLLRGLFARARGPEQQGLHHRDDPQGRRRAGRRDSLEVAQALYDAVICETVPVSSCRAAEATKLMENIFRSINIALVNELKIVFTEMDIDIWEVIRAASTKPFGFMPFYPGPGPRRPLHPDRPVLPDLEGPRVRDHHALHRAGRRDQHVACRTT